MKYSKLLLVLVFLLSAVLYALHAKTTSAQVPDPRVPCGTDADPEFHSLRPYQASPCGDSDKALFCGNNIIINEDASGSTDDCDATELEVNKVINKTYIIDLKETELPILGNTENVKNSQGGTEEFDDATKMNEYLSWYLSGVNNRAEYGESTDEKVVNFSGPVQKLLPSAIQDAQRISTIESVEKTTVYIDGETTKEINEPENHNQIAACAESSLGIIGDITGLGSFTPRECYGGAIFRLKDWEGNLSLWNDFLDKIVGAVIKLLPSVPENIIRESILDHWNKRTPPLPWDKDNEDKPLTALKYQKYYNEWRGKTCVIVPVIDKLLCFDNVFVPNKYADLFSYIPLANTVDKNAKVIVVGDKAQIHATNGTTLSPIYRNDLLETPVLFFPHAKEDKDLVEFLNKSYIPQEGTDNSVDFKTAEVNVGTTHETCRVVNLRSNEGDNLFAETDPNQYQVAVNFTIEKIPCQSECIPHEDDEGNIWYSKKCQGGATIEIKTNTKTPFAADIAQKAVTGNNSTFRRIFPKVGEGAPVSCIADIPTVTNAVYEPTQGTSEIKVVGPQGSGDGTDAKLFFPHIGSVYEYFLKGIQTALRPKGYGEPIVSGEFCRSEEIKECDVSVPDSAVPSKYLGDFKSRFMDLANGWSLKCPGAENNLAEECYNFVASTAQKEGVNPAFALTIWLNESGASNYCEGGETTQDFGINISSLYKDLAGQLLRFIGMAKTKYCEGVSGFREPMHGWLSRFKSVNGTCDPDYECGTAYTYGGTCTEPDGTILDLNGIWPTTWQWVTGGCTSNGKFAIQWPTDMSCP